MTAPVVLDASAAVPLLLGGRLGAAVRAEVATAQLLVPAHFDAEVVNALKGIERGGHLTPSRAGQAVRRLATLPAARVDLPPLIEAAWPLRHGLSSYDAWYVALARSAGARLVTSDARWARAGGLGVSLVTVS